MSEVVLKGFEGIVRREVSLAMHSWLQLGGPAEYYAEPNSVEELAALFKAAHEAHLPIRLLGAGSNLLISDSGVPGLVVRLTAPAFCDIQIEGSYVTSGAGVRLGRLITSSVYAGLAGLEGMIGIPGTVGGAITRNVSTSDGHLGEWVNRVKIVTFTGEIQELSRDQIAFDYHSCSIGNAAIVAVRFGLTKEQTGELSRRLQKNWIVRKKIEPGFQSARLFQDLRGVEPADLIASSGLKGTRIGGAAISERNANFVVVDPDSSCSDVKRLIQLVEGQIRDQCQVDLELELEIW